MRSLFVIGTGGLAREVAMVARTVGLLSGRWESISFIARDTSEIGKDLGYGKVVGDDAWLLGQRMRADVVPGIGHPSVRHDSLGDYLAQPDKFTFPNIVHPTAIVDLDRVQMGCGNVITAGCVLTCDIGIGDFNLFNLNCTIGHDATIGNFNVFNPAVNISGNVTVGDRILVGTGAQILENLRLGDDATVGAGAVVRCDVAPRSVVVGVPAKPIVR